MAEQTYWLAVFTGTTWQQFLDAGGNVYGLTTHSRNMASRTKPGDILLCYVAGVSRFIGLLEVVSAPFEDHTPIWSFDVYPVRLRVTIKLALSPETAVPVKDMQGLSIFQNLKSPSSWAMHFRTALKKWDSKDAQIVIKALEKAKISPQARRFFKSLWAKEPL